VKEIFKSLKKILPVLGLILFFYLIYTSDLEKIKTIIISMNPALLIIALILTLPRTLLRNYAWQIIQKEQNINIKYWESLKIFLIGFFYCSITPGYIGHLMRVPYLKEHTRQPYGKLFVNTLIETIVHSISLYILISIGLILVIDLAPETRNITVIWILWIIVNIIVIYYFINKNRGEKLLYNLIKIVIIKKLSKNLKSFISTFYTDFPNIKKLITPLLIGIVTWIIAFTQEYMFVISFGINIPYIYFIFLFPIANIIGFIPVTFAGIGTREATAILIFTTLFTNVSKEEILLVSLFGFLTVDVFTGLIGFILSLTEAKDVKNYFLIR